MKILGIDPGSARLGYGLIEATPGKLALIDYGVIEPQPLPPEQRLLALGEKLDALIAVHRPDGAGVEELFFGKNRKTAIAVAEARGVALFILARHGIPIAACPPQSVKATVAGYGLADKRAVAAMTAKFLAVERLKGYDDASDALAIAITAFHTLKWS